MSHRFLPEIFKNERYLQTHIFLFVFKKLLCFIRNLYATNHIFTFPTKHYLLKIQNIQTFVCDKSLTVY